MRVHAIAVTALLLTACTGTEPGPTETAEPQTLAVTALDGLTWEIPELGVRTGTVDVTLRCGGELSHGLAIEGVLDGVELASCDGGGASTATVELAAGSYTFFCTVPGHRDAGMEGTLTAS